jgi:hypothetical protein
MDKLTELVDAVERRTLSIDRDRTEEDVIAVQVSAVVDALRRLVAYVQSAFEDPDEELAALSQAETALETYDGIHDDVGAGPQ